MIPDEANSFVMNDAPGRRQWVFGCAAVPGFLSVIIPVYKDAEGLAVTLGSLETQSLARSQFEILVANDGGDPEISALCLKKGVAEIPIPENGGSYAARNAALVRCRGEFVAFADADVRLNRRWCEAGLAALAAMGRADLAAGNTMVDVGKERSAARLYQYCFDFPAATYVRDRGMAQTVNLFVRRQVFEEIGFFDDRLRSAGDFEWTGRATKGGKRLVYAAQAIAFHPARSYRQLLARAERILYGQLATRRLHPQSAEPKSRWRLFVPPSPRWVRRMQKCGLTWAEIVKVYFFTWWLKVRWVGTLARVRKSIKGLKGPMGPKSVSIIINNYNYGRFLGECIDSALGQAYPHCQVIVVDDGSTDESGEVIRRYGGRIAAIFKANGGQASAYHAGFQQATGELVHFLDADDRLREDCMEKVVAAWREGVSKVQFHLSIIDEHGKPANARVPSGRLTGEKAFEMMNLFGAYCSPPGSGNVFTRTFLERLFPFPQDLPFAADALPILAAPYFGTIVSIQESLGCYRRHDAANSSGTLAEFEPGATGRRLEEEHARDDLREDALGLLLSHLSISRPAPRYREPTRAKRELCQLRLGKGRSGNPGDRMRVAWSGIQSSLRWDGYKPAQRLTACTWFLLTACMPYALAVPLIKVALHLSSRPRWMSRFLSAPTIYGSHPVAQP